MLLFALGAILGSFLNVAAVRYGTGRGIVRGRSACPQCRATLRWWELVPIISFILLRARCARCGARIHWQYPLVELVMGLAVMVLVLPLPTTALDVLAVLLRVSIAAVLLVLVLIDQRTFLLPDQYVGTLSALVMLLLAHEGRLLTAETWLAAAAGSGMLLLLWAVTRGRGLGLGDVKLLLPLGALVGWPSVVVLLWLAFVIGGAVGLVLLATRRATMKTALPFGPYLAGVGLCFVLWPELPVLLLRRLGVL